MMSNIGVVQVTEIKSLLHMKSPQPNPLTRPPNLT